MKKIFIFIYLSLFYIVSHSQTLKGYVFDKNSDESLPGVNVYYKDKDSPVGVSTDQKGYYEISLPNGGSIVNFSYIGYEAEAHPIVIRKGQDMKLNIYLKPKEELMKEVVISAGRFEQELSAVTVSMEVLKPIDLIKQNPRDLSVILNTVSGVDVVDKQLSIRGGSSWTYGVGSRCLVLVDGMSVLTPSVGDVNWNMIPLQNVAQVEVIKGASSVLYGSSALNGLINILTERPSLQPQTRINTYMGAYLNPDNKDYIWWEKGYWKEGKFKVKPLLRSNVLYGIRNPIYCGTDFSHSRRIGNFDITVGGDMYTNEGYREDDFNQRLRLGGNITYHDKKISGMNYGFNTNILFNNYSGFFIWKSAQQAYNQSPLTNMSRQGNMIYVDPFFNYVNPRNGTSHHVKSRYFFKSEELTNIRTNSSMLDILASSGFDPAKTQEMVDYFQSPDFLNTILSYISIPISNSNFSGLASELENIGKQFAPNMTTPDLVNMISWIMGHTPFPENSAEILPWLTSNSMQTVSQPDKTHSYFLDYQFGKELGFAQFTTGVTYNHLSTNSVMTGLHESDNIAAFFQYDQKFLEKLNVSAGIRLEYYRVDSLLKEATTTIFGTEIPFKPVFRGGINYQLAEYTFLRSSFGQGYRYPSVTEKFVYKDIGGIAAYPNKNLLPESGYNAEVGIKQGYKIGEFAGFLDIAGFYTHYKNMIEFQFGLFDNKTFEMIEDMGVVIDDIVTGILSNNFSLPSVGLGTRFANVDAASISGIDVSINGIWNISPASSLSYNIGYVFINPIETNWKDNNATEDDYIAQHPLSMREKSNASKYLKYRQKHTFKGVFDFEWNRVSFGINCTYKSKTLAVDYFLIDERDKEQGDFMDVVRSVIFSGLHDYWKDYNKGYFAMDARFGIKINNSIRAWVMVNNIFNKEYSMRPMDIAPPRTLIFQANIKI